MRKFLTILFISIHLTGNTEIGQLLKLPLLVRHYYQHHQQDPSVDFFDFIAMHYAGDDGNPADDETDKQLPCHNIHHNTIALAFSPMVKELPSFELAEGTGKNYNCCPLTHIPSPHVHTLLQPPRLS